MIKTLIFDNLQDFRSPTAPVSYWSWRDFAHNNTRQIMQWHSIKNSPADYLRADAYAGDDDFSIIGKNYAHVSPMGAIEWCWPVDGTRHWRIGIDMYFIHQQCQNSQVVELWQDDILLWRRGFTAGFPVSDCLYLDTNTLDGELRLLVLSETQDNAYGEFVYRLKLCPREDDNHSIDFGRQSQVYLPLKNQMFAGLDKLPPDLQRKLYEKECAIQHLTPGEKTALQQAVTARALQQLNLPDRIFGESGFFRLYDKPHD